MTVGATPVLCASSPALLAHRCGPHGAGRSGPRVCPRLGPWAAPGLAASQNGRPRAGPSAPLAAASAGWRAISRRPPESHRPRRQTRAGGSVSSARVSVRLSWPGGWAWPAGPMFGVSSLACPGTGHLCQSHRLGVPGQPAPSLLVSPAAKHGELQPPVSAWPTRHRGADVTRCGRRQAAGLGPSKHSSVGMGLS